MIDPGLEKRILDMPEIQAGKDIWQNEFHAYDVYGHTLCYVEYIKRLTSDTDIIVAGYLHDIGKPIVKTPKFIDGVLEERGPGKPYHKFTGHEQAGADMVRQMDPGLFAEYGLDQQRIARLVGAHYLPMRGVKAMRKAPDWDSFESAYRDLEDELDSSGLEREEVMVMFLADILSKGEMCPDKEELMKLRQVIGGKEDLEEIYKLQKHMYGGKSD